MSVGRMAFTATLLPNGKVLVAGGSTYAASCFATAEIYDPSTGRWTATGSMAQPRCFHIAALLPSGDVLVAGGVETAFGSADTVATAELYNPSTGVWQTTGSLNVARATAAGLLENGRVLVTGGYNFVNGIFISLASAELYDPSTGEWMSTASMKQPDSDPATPVILTNGDVLLGDEGQFYNPAMAVWTSTGALPKTAGPPTVATLLNSGNVLASGARCTYSGCGHQPTNGCFLYAFFSNSWSSTGSMNQSRIAHTSTLLLNGKALVAGGYSGGNFTVLSSAELYTP